MPTIEQCKQAFADGAHGRNRPTDPTLLDYWLSSAGAGGVTSFLDKDLLARGTPVTTADDDDDDDDYDYDDYDDGYSRDDYD